MPRPILLDANLCVLVAVGLADKAYITKHKRLQGYAQRDFDAVAGLIASSSGVIFTPNVLTETSNLLRHIDEPIRSEVALVLARMIANSEERYVESSTATKRPEYARLGLTDAVLLDLAEHEGVLLTVDLPLYLAATQSGFEAINYNHVRATWL